MKGRDSNLPRKDVAVEEIVCNDGGRHDENLTDRDEERRGLGDADLEIDIRKKETNKEREREEKGKRT